MTEAEAFPAVSDDAALGDRAFFARFPNRRFRGRAGNAGYWIVRRRGDVMLRTYRPVGAPVGTDADEKGLVRLWFSSAFPDWPPERVKKSARKSLRKTR